MQEMSLLRETRSDLLQQNASMPDMALFSSAMFESTLIVTEANSLKNR